ncbi:hypothetical protein pb186bvf_004980 [Paramecium bursaria]
MNNGLRLYQYIQHIYSNMDQGYEIIDFEDKLAKDLQK